MTTLPLHAIAWTRLDLHRYLSPDSMWAVEHLLDEVQPGWYLIGPDVPNGRWLDRWPEMALLAAERHIAAHDAATTDTTTGGTR